jgi:hypothetical protein
MNGCLVYGNKWVGAFGQYDIPEVIMWLAEKVQLRNKCPSLQFSINAFRKFWEEPGFKIIEEWGTWRDYQSQLEYENNG